MLATIDGNYHVYSWKDKLYCMAWFKLSMDSGLSSKEIVNRSLGITIIFTGWILLVSIILILNSGEKSIISFLFSLAFLTNLYPVIVMIICYFVCRQLKDLNQIIFAVSVTSICFLIMMNLSVIFTLIWFSSINDLGYQVELSEVFPIHRLFIALFSGLVVGVVHWAYNTPSENDEFYHDDKEVDLDHSLTEIKIKTLESKVKEISDVLSGLLLKMKAKMVEESHERDWENKKNFEKSISILDIHSNHD
jgi:hypothetical protein